MDRERLTSLLGTPGEVSRNDLADLKDLAERFPWFSGARLLLAVGEDKAGDVLANDRSTSPAAQLPSRAVLFDLVRKDTPRPHAPMQVVRNTAELDVVNLLEKVERAPSGTPLEHQGAPDHSVPGPTLQQPLQGPSEVNEPANAERSEPPLPASATVTTEGTLHPPVPPPPPERTTTANEPVDRRHEDPHSSLSATATREGTWQPSVPLPEQTITGSEIALDVPKQAPRMHDPLESLYREAVANAPFDVADAGSKHREEAARSIVEPVPVQPEPKATAEPIAAPPVPTAVLSKHTKLSFTDWLDQAVATAAPAPLPHAGEATVPEAIVPLQDKGLIHPGKEDLPSPDEILERFIQRSSPAPIVPKAEFYSPQQAAKKSLLDEGLVSETLGRIYEKQGNFAKAIEVYSQLAKQDPRKSVYFAALLKALEGRTNK